MSKGINQVGQEGVGAIRNKGLVVLCLVPLLSVFITSGAGQNTVRYPQNAGDIIAFVEVFSRVDYSVNDAIKHLGTVNPANHDDEVYLGDSGILLTPFPPNQDKIKRVLLGTFDDNRKLDSVQIDYTKSGSISYGELRKKYGEPSHLFPPRINCRPGVDCWPRFVGYEFRFVPDDKSLASGKRHKVFIDLDMEWSKVVPRHTDKSLLAIKSIRFKRVWND